MTNRITLRNLLGGFLGGSVGIIVSWYIAPMALPFGVLVGCILGWFHVGIAEIFREVHRQAKTHQFGKRFSDYIAHLTSTAIDRLGQFSGLPGRMFAPLRWLVVTLCVKMPVGIFRVVMASPRRLWRWLNAHPMNSVDLVYGLVALTYVVATPILVWTWLVNTGLHPDGAHWRVFLTVVAVVTGVAIHLNIEDIGKRGQGFLYYKNWEIASRYSLVGLSFYLTGQFIRYSVGAVLFAVVVFWWGLPLVIACGVLFLFVILPLALLTRAYYKVASGSGHWMCLGVTLVTTFAMWSRYHENFADPRILWTTALGAGIVSGVATELLRHAMLAFFSRTKLGQTITEKEGVEKVFFGDDGHDDGLAIGLMSRLPGFWFRQNRLARGFRALTIGAPLRRPVRIV